MFLEYAYCSLFPLQVFYTVHYFPCKCSTLFIISLAGVLHCSLFPLQVFCTLHYFPCKCSTLFIIFLASVLHSLLFPSQVFYTVHYFPCRCSTLFIIYCSLFPMWVICTVIFCQFGFSVLFPTQVFCTVNEVLSRDPKAREQRLAVRTYHVTPLSQATGLVQWCNNSQVSPVTSLSQATGLVQWCGATTIRLVP